MNRKNVNKKSRKLVIRRRIRFRNGKANLGVMLVLVIIGTFSLFLVFGTTRLTQQGQDYKSKYFCCDSGDGALCKPNTDTQIQVKQWLKRTEIVSGEPRGGRAINGGPYTYYLLKSGIKLLEGVGHMVPLRDSDISVGKLPYDELITNSWPGKHVYENNTDIDFEAKVNECGNGTGNIYDQIARKAAKVVDRCVLIPDDIILYVCTKGCDDNGKPKWWGFADATYNAYIRKNDYDNLGKVPDAIAYCEKPASADENGAVQVVIKPSTPPGKPNLQFETFEVQYQGIMAEWISPWCKPAVYLYPEEETSVLVKIKASGKLLYTDPLYPPSGWQVTAYPDGLLVAGGKNYDYLYYEAEIPDEKIILPEEGYVISSDELAVFLPQLVSELGLNEKETLQFTNYWLKVLPESEYYKIKILGAANLDDLSVLDVVPSPDSTIRVTLHFEAIDRYQALPKPAIVALKRTGFTLVEWGGIFKRNGNQAFSCLM